MLRGARVALVAALLGLIAAPPSVLGQRGGTQTEGDNARGRSGGSSGGGSLSGGRGGGSSGGSSLGSTSGSSQSGSSGSGGSFGGVSNRGGGGRGGDVTVGSNNGNGNEGDRNGNNNGNGNTISSGGQGNQVGGTGNQYGGQGNQGGSGNVNQGGAGNNNQNQQGNEGSSQSNNGNANGCYVNGIFRRDCAGGKSDPIMTGFAGRSFNFFGEVNKFYNLISEANHQLSMHLKFAQLHDHNGTNMDRIGLQFQTYRVEMAINAAEEVTVAVNDKLLAPKKTLQTHAWRYPDGKMVEMSWELHRPGLGNTVVFSTDTLEITAWYVPAGIPEPGHPEILLGSYLNFNITLQGPPVNNRMEGIVGETYQRYAAGMAAISDPNNTALYAENDGAWKGLHPIQQYEMANLWDVKFPLTLFNSTEVAPVKERSQLELDTAVPELPVLARGCSHCAASR